MDGFNPVKFLRAIQAGEYDNSLAEAFNSLSLEELRQVAAIVTQNKANTKALESAKLAFHRKRQRDAHAKAAAIG